MAAQFPTAVKSFTRKVDLVDTIYADHVNTLQDEVRAVEDSLGTSLLTSSYTGTFSSTFDWTSLSDRLANIEAGLVTGTTLTSGFLKKTGDTITANVGTIGLLVQPSSGSTADIFQTKNSDASLGFRVDYLGVPYVGTNAVVYVGSSAYNSLAASVSDGSVTTAKLADSAVTSAKIADGTIVNGDISSSAAIALSKLATDPLARTNHTGTQTASTISNFDTQVRTNRLDQMASPTSSVSFNSQKITNLADPTNSQDAATKTYVDTKVSTTSSGFDAFLLAGM